MRECSNYKLLFSERATVVVFGVTNEFLVYFVKNIFDKSVALRVQMIIRPSFI